MVTDKRAGSSWLVGVIIGLTALLLRVLVGLHGHSGEGTPPKYGDYEAQRHWMEITLNTPIHEWYTETPSNPLEYWGIDYPPLSAYQSYVSGLVVRAWEPAATDLATSRGHESSTSKQAMRLTVILSDLIVLLPAVFCAAVSVSKLVAVPANAAPVDVATKVQLQRGACLITFAVAALQPALLLIDHGHFQYNGIGLGLSAAAAAAVLQGWHMAGSVLFTLSLNHKQMLMYFAPAFFSYLLGRCLRVPPLLPSLPTKHTLQYPQSTPCSSRCGMWQHLLTFFPSASYQVGHAHPTAHTPQQVSYASSQRGSEGVGGDRNDNAMGAAEGGGGATALPAGGGGMGGQGSATPPIRSAAPSETPSVPETVREPDVASSECSQPGRRWRGWAGAIAAIASLGVAVVATFAAVWAPFLFPKPGAAVPVLSRLVPLHRGLFEDYVANFWCSTHAAIKWKRLLPQRTLVHACTAATLAALLPSCMHQILQPSRRGLLYCMLNSSLAFFLFSYQVHEKSILMPMLPLALLHVLEPRVSTFMLIVAPFSMFPLLLKDGQCVPYVALVGCACVAAPDISNAWHKVLAHTLEQPSEGPAMPVEGGALAPVGGGARETGQVGGGGGGIDGHLPSPALPVREPAEAAEQSDRDREAPVQMLPEPSEDSQLSCSTQMRNIRRRRIASPDSRSTGVDMSEVEKAVARARSAAWRSCLLRPHTWPVSLVEGEWWWAYVWGCCITGCCLHMGRLLFQPPANLPYLHDLLQTSFAFVQFAGLFVYSNAKQLRLPVEL